MKNRNLIRSLFGTLVLLFGFAALFTGCSKDEPSSGPSVTEGVIFRFERKALYKTGVNEIGSVKITLTKGSEKLVLPSSRLTGDTEQVVTEAFTLAPGEYEIVGYVAYDQGHNFLFEIELDTDSELVKTSFVVEPGAVTTFPVPVKTRELLNQNFIRNALMGLCLEVFGEDQSVWPWDPKEYPYPDWEGLEFEMDDYGNPMFISGIYFNGLKDGEPTAWRQMKALPEGTVARILTISNLTFTDLPDLTALAPDLNTMPDLSVLTLVNTGVGELPANLGGIKALRSLTVVNSGLTEAPRGIENLTDLRLLHLRGNQITRFETSLKALTKLESVDLGDNPLESIGEGVFAADGKVCELVLDRTNLSELPAGIASMSLLRTVNIADCRFTSVPSALRRHEGLGALYLNGNPLTSVSASDFSGMTNLQSLYLQGVQLGTLGRLDNRKLVELNISGCSLSAAPDLSGLSNLGSLLMGNNKFSTIPSAYFTGNPKMRVLNLSNSPSLTSMGAGDLGLKAKISDTQDGFKWLLVSNCPSLRWTTPAEWNCFDGAEDGKFDNMTSVLNASTRRPDIDPDIPIDVTFGRVAVNRKGSPNLVFGK